MGIDISLEAGFAACRSYPPGYGVQSHSLNGFGIYMLSNHDPDDTFMLRVHALFIPGDRGYMTWRALTPDQVLTLVAALAGFSERHFGESVLDDVDRELIDEINSFLSSGN